MIDFSAFETSNWRTLSQWERVEKLQGLEDSMAAKQGRLPRTISSNPEYPDRILGGYVASESDLPGKPGLLHINSKKLIESNGGNYKAIDTVIHEGRHAYQDDCIQGKIAALPQDQSKVNSWAHNAGGRGGVYNGGGVGYRYQPVEVDAHDYSKAEMSELSSQFGKDPAYVKFCAERDQDDETYKKLACMWHGIRYEQTIRQDIEQRYQEKEQKLSEGQNNIQKTGDNKGMFDFKKDKSQRQKANESSLHSGKDEKSKVLRQSNTTDNRELQKVKSTITPSQSSPSLGSKPAYQAQHEPTEPKPTANISKYRASEKTSKPRESSTVQESKEGQKR